MCTSTFVHLVDEKQEIEHGRISFSIKEGEAQVKLSPTMIRHQDPPMKS